MLFNVEEVSEIISQQNHKKAPGGDGLTADIIQTIHNCDQTLITSLFNKCLKLNFFPDIWKESVVKVIPKTGKTDYTDTNSYRPISLLPVMAKVFEKLIINRITDYLRKNNLVSERQYGFTPQFSTEKALHSVKDLVTYG
jgi:hypothetical protein